MLINPITRVNTNYQKKVYKTLKKFLTESGTLCIMVLRRSSEVR